MTIAILTNDGSTRLPRPWNRASSHDELVEMIGHFDRHKARQQRPRSAVEFALDRIDTDDPVAEVETATGKVAFYAFTER